MNRSLEPVRTPRLECDDAVALRLYERLTGSPVGTNAGVVSPTVDVQRQITDQEIDVVRADRGLLAKRAASVAETLRKPTLVIADADQLRLARLCSANAGSHRVSATPTRRVGHFDAAPQIGPLPMHRQLGVTVRAHRQSTSDPRPTQAAGVDARRLGNGSAALTSGVSLMQRAVIQSESTSSGSHMRIVSNCVRDFSPVLA